GAASFSPLQASAQSARTVPAAAPPTAAELARVEQKVEVLDGGSSTRAARKKAATLLPLHQMSARDRKRAEDVVKHCSVFREMPMLRFECNPHVYKYFVNYPDAAAS